MTRKALVLAVLSTIPGFGNEHLNVLLCNFGRLPDATTARAMRVVEAIFRPMRIDMHWSACRIGAGAQDSWTSRTLIVRLRRDGPAHGAASFVDVMGTAFTEDGGAGYLADAYYGAIYGFALDHQSDPAEALGYVMAHEIGHLLLGAGHAEGTIMSARWNAKSLAAARQRWLRFSPSQRAAIHRELQAGTVLTASVRRTIAD